MKTGKTAALVLSALFAFLLCSCSVNPAVNLSEIPSAEKVTVFDRVIRAGVTAAELTTEKQTTAAAAVTETKTQTQTQTTTAVTTEKKTTTEKRTSAAGKKAAVKPLPAGMLFGDDCAFVGNSRMLHFKEYGLAQNVYATVGLTVDTVFTEPCQGGGSCPVIDELNGKSFKKIYLMFGDNECGWPYFSVFAEHYKAVIDAVKQRCPGAEIYLQGVLPISKSASERNEFGANNGAIEEMNVYIKELAEKEGVHYTAPGEVLKDENGCLPEEAAFDGVHMEAGYCGIWAQYLKDNT